MKNIIKEILSFILIFIVIFFGVRLFTDHVAQPLEVDGESMYDTLEHGEKLWLLRLADIDRFDVVVFPAPPNPESLYVKRVIGVPGDTIAFENDQLILNGQALDEPYLASMIASADGDFTRDFTVDEPVPEGHVFVMGDNRRNSVDSRSFGFVKLEEIQGEANGIYWPLSHMRLLENWELSDSGDAIIQN